MTWLRLRRCAVHLPVPRRFLLCIDCARFAWGLFDRDALVGRELVGVTITLSYSLPLCFCGLRAGVRY